MKITKKQLKKIIKEAMRGPEDLPYGNVTGKKKPAYNTGPKGRPTQGSIRQYLAANYDDFIDLYIRTSSSPERFWDIWEMHCDDKGIACTQDHLVALVDQAEQMGEVEEGELFIGDRGY